MLRGGGHDEDVPRFLSENRVFLGWGQNLLTDLSKFDSKDEFKIYLKEKLSDLSERKIANVAGQLTTFAKKMKSGDWVIVPHRNKAAIHIAELIGSYIYDAKTEKSPFHYRMVKWIANDIPRSIFDQDLLYSFGGLATIYQIKRNEAESRVREFAKRGWEPSYEVISVESDDGGDEAVDLELLARDQIAKLVIRKFKGHGLARLVEAILKAQGYTTYLSPEGPDKGIDILAAPGPLGFGKPRICVQVKSGDSPADSPTLNQLIGTMQNVQADQGLLVSWGGFKSSVDREVPTQFFRVRLWDQETLINEFLGIYDKLDADLRAEVPVKRIWSLAAQEEEE